MKCGVSSSSPRHHTCTGSTRRHAHYGCQPHHLHFPLPSRWGLPGAHQVGRQVCGRCARYHPFQRCLDGAWMVRWTPSGARSKTGVTPAPYSQPPHAQQLVLAGQDTPPTTTTTCRQARTTPHFTPRSSAGGGRRHRHARTRPSLCATPPQQPQWAQIKDRQER